MKRIVLLLEDDVYGALRTNLMVRAMGGSAGGVIDSFVKVLVDEIEKGTEEKHFYFRDPADKGD